MSAFDMARLVRAIQVGLQFNITPGMRFIFADLRDQTIHLTAYFEDEPTAEEREMLVDAAAEAAAQAESLLQLDVRCIRDSRPFRLIPQEGDLVYARHEKEL